MRRLYGIEQELQLIAEKVRSWEEYYQEADDLIENSQRERGVFNES